MRSNPEECEEGNTNFPGLFRELSWLSGEMFHLVFPILTKVNGKKSWSRYFCRMSALTGTDPTRKVRKILGWSILIMFVLGIYAEATRTAFIDWSDPQVTWINIAKSRLGYSFMIIAFIVIIFLDTVIAIGVLTIFRTRNGFLVTLTAALRLVYVAIKGVALNGLFMAGGLYFGEEYTQESGSQALTNLKSHQYGFSVGLILFGLHLILLARVARLTQCPKWIPWILWSAGLGYVINSLASLLIDDAVTQSVIIGVFIVPMTFSEIVFFLWLWRKGFSGDQTIALSQPSPDPA